MSQIAEDLYHPSIQGTTALATSAGCPSPALGAASSEADSEVSSPATSATWSILGSILSPTKFDNVGNARGALELQVTKPNSASEDRMGAGSEKLELRALRHAQPDADDLAVPLSYPATSSCYKGSPRRVP